MVTKRSEIKTPFLLDWYRPAVRKNSLLNGFVNVEPMSWIDQARLTAFSRVIPYVLNRPDYHVLEDHDEGLPYTIKTSIATSNRDFPSTEDGIEYGIVGSDEAELSVAIKDSPIAFEDRIYTTRLTGLLNFGGNQSTLLDLHEDTEQPLEPSESDTVQRHLEQIYFDFIKSILRF